MASKKEIVGVVLTLTLLFLFLFAICEPEIIHVENSSHELVENVSPSSAPTKKSNEAWSWITAVTTEGEGVLGKVVVSVTPGKGDISTIIQKGGKVSTTGSTLDAAISDAIKAAEEFSGIKTDDKDIAVSFEFNFENVTHVSLEGPSAGIPILLASYAALSDKSVDKKVASTGEVSLDGKLLPVSGVYSKALAAAKGGVKLFLIPQGQPVDRIVVEPIEFFGFPVPVIRETQEIIPFQEFKSEMKNLGMDVQFVGSVEQAIDLAIV